MGHQCHHHRKERRRLACIICLFITVLLIILLLILYFAAFKPKDPRVQVPIMQMMSYRAVVGSPPSMSSVSFGLDLQVLISNPNRGDFYIEGGSTASIYYGGTQLAVTVFPNNTHISSQSSITFGVTVLMQRPILLNLSTIYTNQNIIIPMPVSSIVTIFGHVTTASVFSHHSIVVSICNVSVALGSAHAYIQSYACNKSYPLND